MSLSHKTLLIVTTAIVGVLVVLYATTRSVLLQSSSQLEEQQARSAVERIRIALHDELAGLAATANEGGQAIRQVVLLRESTRNKKQCEADLSSFGT